MLIQWRQFNVKGAAAYTQFIRYVFYSFAKASSDRALLRTASGKPFKTRRGGFNGWPLVQWQMRPLGGWALEAPGPRGPRKAKFWLAIAKS